MYGMRRSLELQEGQGAPDVGHKQPPPYQVPQTVHFGIRAGADTQEGESMVWEGHC